MSGFTVTDAERDQLVQEPGIIDQFREALLQADSPPTDVPLAQFVVESQETVDREYGNSWSRRQYVRLRRRHG